MAHWRQRSLTEDGQREAGQRKAEGLVSLPVASVNGTMCQTWTNMGH